MFISLVDSSRFLCINGELSGQWRTDGAVTIVLSKGGGGIYSGKENMDLSKVLWIGRFAKEESMHIWAIYMIHIYPGIGWLPRISKSSSLFNVHMSMKSPKHRFFFEFNDSWATVLVDIDHLTRLICIGDWSNVWAVFALWKETLRIYLHNCAPNSPIAAKRAGKWIISYSTISR